MDTNEHELQRGNRTIVAEKVLSILGKTTCRSLATDAVPSDERMLRKASRRVGVDHYFRHVFAAETVGRMKNEPESCFYVLDALGAKPEEITVVGDNFTGDVQSPASAGLRAVWLNSLTPEVRIGDRYCTIHQLTELLEAKRRPGQTGEPIPSNRRSSPRAFGKR